MNSIPIDKNNKAQKVIKKDDKNARAQSEK